MILENIPDRDCGLCPRLVDFRNEQRQKFPDWHNAPVPSFGSLDARLLIVGLAPGLRGANRTGRPFTGDHAGNLLYPTMIKFGFATGNFAADPDDGLALSDCRICNAVRCVPPANKPVAAEMNACRPYLVSEIAAMPRLKAIFALGRIAHDNVLRTMKLRLAENPFGHAAVHNLCPAIRLYDSYHCSRYNTNTGRLTEEMFENVFEKIRADLD
jgi:uracil-DNA glycosylase